MTENYFTEEELSCPCCGRNEFNPATKLRFNKLRVAVDEPLPMTSGYRCPTYNRKNGWTLSHSTGQCGDLAVSHKLAFKVMAEAPKLGFTGIGVSQKGNKRFLHLDDLEEELPKRPRPHLWSY